MRYRHLLLLLIVALIVASLSGFHEYAYVIRWDRCGSLKGRCPLGFLGAGFPLPFLIDNLAIPGEGQLILGKSDFIWAVFVVDVLTYLTLGRLIVALGRRIVRSLSSKK
jgi:ABC-type uncharacterized transport system permease subunit